MVNTRKSLANKRQHTSPLRPLRKRMLPTSPTSLTPKRSKSVKPKNEVVIDIKVTKIAKKLNFEVLDSNDIDMENKIGKKPKALKALQRSNLAKSAPPKPQQMDNDSEISSDYRYPTRSRKYSQKMQDYLDNSVVNLKPKSKPLASIKKVKEIKEKIYKFKDSTQQENLVWIGNPEVKLTRNGNDIVFYEKVRNEILQDEICMGDIVEMYPIDEEKPIHGEIIFLLEDNQEKKAEVRLIYGSKSELTETHECFVIPLTKIYQKVEFSEENGYFCNFLRSKDKSVIKVNPNERRERSLKYSKVYLDLEQNENPLLKAIALLTLSSVPSKLVGREKEVSEITEFLKTSISLNGSKNSLYICGSPGTGKTATFLYVINQLENSPDYSNEFQFIYLNCMKFNNPRDLYPALCNEIFGCKRHPKPVEILANYFRVATKENLIILLIDEIDALINKQQDVLYNIYNWTTLANSNLIVAGISNTMNLSEKFIHKISSRMGKKQIVFAPYKREELDRIVAARLTDTKVFSKEAILFAAAKVASYSGDARKIFQVCKRAAFIASEQKHQLVKMDHIQAAFKQLFASVYVQVISRLPFYLKLFLITLCLEMKNNQIEQASVDKLKFRLNNYCEMVSRPKLTLSETDEISSRLASLTICIKDNDLVKLGISADEVLDGLKSDPLMEHFDSMLCGH